MWSYVTLCCKLRRWRWIVRYTLSLPVPATVFTMGYHGLPYFVSLDQKLLKLFKLTNWIRDKLNQKGSTILANVMCTYPQYCRYVWGEEQHTEQPQCVYYLPGSKRSRMTELAKTASFHASTMWRNFTKTHYISVKITTGRRAWIEIQHTVTSTSQKTKNGGHSVR